MATSSTTIDPIDDLSGASLRSRASSIVTTTTKFSLETLSQDDRSSIGAIHRLGNRPHSITSIAHPAPPYSEAIDSTLQLPNHHNGDFQSLLSRLAEVSERPAEAVSVNEPLAPSTIASVHTTPAPDSPTDPENPSAQVAYYSSVVRQLDSNYTAELERLRQKHAQELAVARQEHAQELALTRHEIDSAYRTQWKAQNRENEKIREEAAKARDEEVQRIQTESDARVKELEEKVRELEKSLVAQAEEGHEEREKAVEKARHEIEDLWERRWRDRARIEEEEKKRAQVEREQERVEFDTERQKMEMEMEKERVDFEREKELREAFKQTVKEWMSSKGRDTEPIGGQSVT